MDSFTISTMLKKYESSTSLDASIVSFCCVVIKEETGFVINEQLVTVKESTLTLCCIPVLKKEILYKKTIILLKINNQLPEGRTIDAIF